MNKKLYFLLSLSIMGTSVAMDTMDTYSLDTPEKPRCCPRIHRLSHKPPETLDPIRSAQIQRNCEIKQHLEEIEAYHRQNELFPSPEYRAAKEKQKEEYEANVARTKEKNRMQALERKVEENPLEAIKYEEKRYLSLIEQVHNRFDRADWSQANVTIAKFFHGLTEHQLQSKGISKEEYSEYMTQYMIALLMHEDYLSSFLNGMYGEKKPNVEWNTVNPRYVKIDKLKAFLNDQHYLVRKSAAEKFPELAAHIFSDHAASFN